MNKRVVQGSRLIYYGERSDNPEFWSQYWKQEDYLTLQRVAKEGVCHVDVWNLLIKYLSKDEKILEGGCAPGGTVVALNRQGYKIKGIDFSKEAIKRIKEVCPDAPVEIGDVFHLDYPDGSFDAYILLGVVEHFLEELEKSLKEAYRVLGTGGNLLISVPYFNPIRRTKAFLGIFPKIEKWSNIENFYQYAFKPREFTKILEGVGFQVMAVHYYSNMKGIKDEIPLFKKLWDQKKIPYRILRFLRTNNVVKYMVSHMVLFVAKKEELHESI